GGGSRSDHTRAVRGTEAAMALGRGARLGLGILGVAGLLTAGVLAVKMAPPGPPKAGEGEVEVGGGSTEVASSASDRGAGALEGRAALLASGDAGALAEVEGAIAASPAVEGDE